MRRSTGINAGIGLTQYLYGTAFHGEEVTLLGALSATAFGALSGWMGGPGARNAGSIAKKIAGAGATKTTVQNLAKYLGKINMYTSSLSQGIKAIIRSKIINGIISNFIMGIANIGFTVISSLF